MADDCEDGVGYGKPPKASRFQKGKSGNPSGRPRRDPSIADVFRRVSKQFVHTTGRNGPQRMTKLEACITQLVNKAATGDLKWTKVLMQLASRFPELVIEPKLARNIMIQIVDPIVPEPGTEKS